MTSIATRRTRTRTLTVLLAAALGGCGVHTAGDDSPVTDADGGGMQSQGGQSNKGTATEVRIDGGAGETSSTAGRGSTDFEAICTGANWPSATRAVAVAFAGLDLVSMAADGSRETLHTFTPPSAASKTTLQSMLTKSAGGVVAQVAWDVMTGAGIVRDGACAFVDKSGKLVWSLPGIAEQASALGMVGTVNGTRQLTAANGVSHAVPSEIGDNPFFTSAPDADGFMLTSYQTGDLDPTQYFGLVSLAGEYHALSRIRGAGVPYPKATSGKYLYMSHEDAWNIGFATANAMHEKPLGIGKDESLWLEAGDSANANGFGIVSTSAGRPEMLIDITKETATAIDSSAVDAAIDASNDISFTITAGNYWLGTTYGLPLWILHAPDAVAKPVTLGSIAPLRPMDGMFCTKTTLLNDGRFGLGLRDDDRAGFYVTHADGTGLERIGKPMRDVTSIEATITQKTWLIHAYSGIDSYCTPFTPFAAPTEDDDALSGDSVQIIKPGAPELAIEGISMFSSKTLTLDDSGACLAISDSALAGSAKIYDLNAGTHQDLADLTSLTWL